MSKNLISLLGFGPAVKGLVDYFRDWNTANRRRKAEAQLAEETARKAAAEVKKTKAEAQQTIATATKVESEAEKTKAEAEKLRAETIRIWLKSADEYLALVEKYGTLPEGNPNREVIGRALGVLEKHVEAGTIRDIRMVEEGDGTPHMR
jgi:hypothetical protein